jgi:uncharacterized protein
MGQRTGTADLPLHGGRVPEWLASRMAELGRVVVEALLLHFGRDEVLRRLAHPFWFQSLGCVMGMDWHSSGITTSVLAALKRGLAPLQGEIGISICGGRGRASRRTPDELIQVSERTGLDGALLARTSRLVAKVDNTAVQDGFQLYLHSFIVADDGSWVVVQQGMQPSGGTARRYHWLSSEVRSFVEEPHAAIEGEPRGEIINLTDRRAAPARSAQLELIAAGPDLALRELRKILDATEVQATLPHLIMPDHHEVRPENVLERRLHGTLAAAREAGPSSFEELLLVPGVGPRTVESLALVSEVVFGTPSRFTDPARFSLAHGGKDGHPFPVPLRVYDATLSVYRDAIEKAKLGNEVKLAALRRLSEEARRLEQLASGPGVADHIEQELDASHDYGGMTVFGAAKPRKKAKPKKSRKQLALF